MSGLRKIKVFYQDRLAGWLVNLSILTILATWALFIFYRLSPSPLTVLHYNVYAGIDVLGNHYWLYILPGISTLVAVANFLLAVFFWTRQRIWSYQLLTTILFINVVMLIYLYNILNYNV